MNDEDRERLRKKGADAIRLLWAAQNWMDERTLMTKHPQTEIQEAFVAGVKWARDNPERNQT